MCGIAGILSESRSPVSELRERLCLMNELQEHRGPDGEGIWLHPKGHVGFAHRRLSIIDLSTGQQPMTDGLGNWITYNGEIYNYLELRQEIGPESFRTSSDTEVILRAYAKWGADCVNRLRGMFSFAIWDESLQRLFCARDRAGIKPFYYMRQDGAIYFASEAKALLPFLHAIDTDLDSLHEYLTFQFCLGGKTLFRNILELQPGHSLLIDSGRVRMRHYWDVYYATEANRSEEKYCDELREVIVDSVNLHLRSDVPVGSYLSGGIDSSVVASLASPAGGNEFRAFNGKFLEGRSYDESQYARDLARWRGFPLLELEITPEHFLESIRRVIYHLDYPVAGPGSFAQYLVSRLASDHMKVVLGGQGGDEIFGGYARYLLAYFDQCISAAVDGLQKHPALPVPLESLVPGLETLKSYKPLLRQFWSQGLFSTPPDRYYHLLNRSQGRFDPINWEALGDRPTQQRFYEIFLAPNVRHSSYFDQMLHFDFKTLLPALLQVEDRVSMAHGLESRVPFVDHHIVEFAAQIPLQIRFRGGRLKYVLIETMKEYLPTSIRNRTDKMGFPVPLQEWMRGPLRDFVVGLLDGSRSAQRQYLRSDMDPRKGIECEPQFSRSVWGLLSLELWQQEFHDKQKMWSSMLQDSRGHCGPAIETPAMT